MWRQGLAWRYNASISSSVLGEHLDSLPYRTGGLEQEREESEAGQMRGEPEILHPLLTRIIR
jgi:hypothetical protein